MADNPPKRRESILDSLRKRRTKDKETLDQATQVKQVGFSGIPENETKPSFLNQQGKSSSLRSIRSTESGKSGSQRNIRLERGNSQKKNISQESNTQTRDRERSQKGLMRVDSQRGKTSAIGNVKQGSSRNLNLKESQTSSAQNRRRHSIVSMSTKHAAEAARKSNQSKTKKEKEVPQEKRANFLSNQWNKLLGRKNEPSESKDADSTQTKMIRQTGDMEATLSKQREMLDKIVQEANSLGQQVQSMKDLEC